LENVIERAVVLTQTSTVEVEHLPPHLRDSDPVPIPSECFALPLEATLAEIERAAIEQALKRSGGHRQTAARMLDIGSATMYRKLKEYGLE
jgi:DNA-binding NtrC family response regulator